MQTKLFEIRDTGTFIPVMVTRFESTGISDWDSERWLLSRAGYGNAESQKNYYFLQRINSGSGHGSSDSFDHGGARTLEVAHDYIKKHWDDLSSGAVIDVEFILGETEKPKISERFESFNTLYDLGGS